MSDFLVFLVVIGSLILGHELGHFVSGKLLGVKVEEFGIGFPPRMLTLFHAGGTRFSLNWLPLGGFNRFAGEDDQTIEGGLSSSSKITRTIVLLSGSFTNIAIALVAFTIAFRFAAPDYDKVAIAGIDPGTPAEAANILAGDLVLAVEDEPITGFESMSMAISARLGEMTEITLQRGEEILNVNLIPRVEYPEGKGPIGVSLRNPTKEVGWGEAFSIGVDSAYMQFRELILLPVRFIQGNLAPEETRLSGMKGMYDMLVWAGDIDRTFERPFLTLNLIGIISLGLGIANLLPIPALDGGRLMFVLAEALLGRRIDQKFEGFAHTVGFFVLLVVLLYVNIMDFKNPLILP